MKYFSCSKNFFFSRKHFLALGLIFLSAHSLAQTLQLPEVFAATASWEANHIFLESQEVVTAEQRAILEDHNPISFHNFTLARIDGVVRRGMRPDIAPVKNLPFAKNDIWAYSNIADAEKIDHLFNCIGLYYKPGSAFRGYAVEAVDKTNGGLEIKKALLIDPFRANFTKLSPTEPVFGSTVSPGQESTLTKKITAEKLNNAIFVYRKGAAPKVWQEFTRTDHLKAGDMIAVNLSKLPAAQSN